MMSKIKNMIKYGLVKLAGADDKQFPVQQITYNGKAVDCVMLNPFGFHANLDPDTMVGVFAVEGDESNRFAMGGHTKTRPKLAQGEVAVFHPKTQSIIKFEADGTISINTAAKDVNITAANVNIDGNLTVSGTSGLEGAVSAGATVTATGAVAGSTITANGSGRTLDGHSHTGSATAPTGPVSNTGTPV